MKHKNQIKRRRRKLNCTPKHSERKRGTQIHHLESQCCRESHKTHFRIWHRTHGGLLSPVLVLMHIELFHRVTVALVCEMKKSDFFSCAVTIFLRFALTHSVNSFEMPWYQETFSFLFHEIPLEHLSVELLLLFCFISFWEHMRWSFLWFVVQFHSLASCIPSSLPFICANMPSFSSTRSTFSWICSVSVCVFFISCVNCHLYWSVRKFKCFR